MRERLRIAVDLDQTAGAYVAQFRDSVAGQLGIPAADLESDPDYYFTQWSIGNKFSQLHHHAITVDRIFQKMDVMPGASTAMRALDERVGAHISIVTSRLCVPGIHEAAIVDTVSWLDTHNLPYHELHAIRGRDLTKVDTVNFDVLIDDKPEEIQAAREAGKIAVVFGDYRYNRHLSGPRATSWDEVPDLVLGLWQSVTGAR